jgi:hypothetical protein
MTIRANQKFTEYNGVAYVKYSTYRGDIIRRRDQRKQYFWAVAKEAPTESEIVKELARAHEEKKAREDWRTLMQGEKYTLASGIMSIIANMRYDNHAVLNNLTLEEWRELHRRLSE